MKQTALFILLLIATSLARAQSYRYIDIEDGLSNQNVYTIQKDKKGYMWMLTMSGVDRYNGKEFRNYIPGERFEEPGWLFMLHRLHVDANGDVWLVSLREGIMRYDERRDEFVTIAPLARVSMANTPPKEINYSFVDSNNYLWYLWGNIIYLWNIPQQKLSVVKTNLDGVASCMVQTGKNTYAVSTSAGVYRCTFDGTNLNSDCYVAFTDDLSEDHINTMEASDSRIFIGTDRHGLYCVEKDGKSAPRCVIPDISINAIRHLSGDEFLLATDRAGVYKLDASTLEAAPYLTTYYDTLTDIESNNIRDIYIDDEGRTWLACNPYGVSVLSNSLPRYAWLRHSAHTSHSICNNNINDIIEDSEGGVWFATSDGISLLNVDTRGWSSVLSHHGERGNGEPRPVLAICEVEPGIIWAAGYSDDVCVIRKRDMSTSTLHTHVEAGMVREDKYIQAIHRGSNGYVWLGGYYSLRRIDPKSGACRYIDLDQITCITERDADRLWIGTATGLYSVDKLTGKVTYLRLASNRHTYICSLHQAADGLLYIGTDCAGLFVLDVKRGRCRNYNSTNCTLITNNIHTIVSNSEGTKLVLGTDKGLTQYDVRHKLFRNWTLDQGLLTTYFNSTSGVYTTNDYFVMGSNDGAVGFRINTWHDRPMRSRMVLSDLSINYKLVRPGMKDSPLSDDIDNISKLTLSHDQNNLSLYVSSINYDYPSDVVYTWRLLGRQDEWGRLSHEHFIRYSSLSPGHYTLQVRAVSNESLNKILEERTIEIRVKPPLWLSWPALVIYLIAFAFAVYLLIRLAVMIRQRRMSAEKISFFINSAHDIRTPLTLIKAPLDELNRTENFTEEGAANMAIAMRNVDNLLSLTDNLMNFERASLYSARLCKSEVALGAYIQTLMKPFVTYAEAKQISVKFVDNTAGAVVWFDREKIGSVIKNLLSNAVKYTPRGGEVSVTATDLGDRWSVDVTDTGIGIPAAEHRKLFRLYYRASNAINSKVTGSGVGLMLVKRVVEMHKGRISLKSAVGSGTSICITIPKRSKALERAEVLCKPVKEEPAVVSSVAAPSSARLLIVEDNEELQEYLKRALGVSYEVRISNNGKEALTEIREYKPDLIISDIMMPEMRGDELCQLVKSNIETSHIPVILLTALGSESDILHGLSLKADEYIAKPFSMEVLRAKIESILANRRLLWHKYAASGFSVEMAEDDVNRLTELDRRFLDDVHRCINSRIDDPSFGVDGLCSMLAMSRTSFYNKVKALTGSSPVDFIRRMRLSRAAELLKSGEYNVTEVAEMTGFNDAKYFREVFKRHFGMSPLRYGKEQRRE
jgi:signal transduction histidine kinase/ligand-binding sensor domain-containing protein/AraC-like DNA-binding protein